MSCQSRTECSKCGAQSELFELKSDLRSFTHYLTTLTGSSWSDGTTLTVALSLAPASNPAPPLVTITLCGLCASALWTQVGAVTGSLSYSISPTKR